MVGNLGEGVACLTPLLGHLEHVCSPAKHLQGLISLAGPSDMQDKVREAFKTCKGWKYAENYQALVFN